MIASSVICERLNMKAKGGVGSLESMWVGGIKGVFEVDKRF